MKEFRATVLGNLQSKANSRRMIRPGLVIKSKVALEFEESALLQLKAPMRGRKPFEGDVACEFEVYYQSRRSDLDTSLIRDILQKAGVYLNDRQITSVGEWKHLDKNNPRVEITVYEETNNL